MRNYDKVLLHQRGWRDAAGGGPMAGKQELMNYIECHNESLVMSIYGDGYRYGRDDLMKANKEAAKKYGVTTHEIKMAMLR
jgi:hypothetical protein